jgi:cholesterol transport system auxiliary component
VTPVRSLTIALLLGLVPGCALTSRAEPVRWQFFTPERVQPRLESASVGSAHREVCLGRVTAGTDLGRRIAHGNGGHEVGYYEDRRWTEEPERYVRRALERALVEESSFPCEIEPSPSRLDVEVLKFEELRTPAGHAARVALRAVVTTEDVILDETIQWVDIVHGSSFDDVVAAIGRALEQVSVRIAHRANASAKPPPEK